MSARPQKFAKSGGVSSVMQRYYTAYEEVNVLLNAYAQQAKDEKIQMSIDGGGFRENVLNERFCDLLGCAITQAFVNCRKMNPPQKRYIKITSMDGQHKVFVKISYPCEEEECEDADCLSPAISSMLKRAEGYFKIQNIEMEQVIMIAVPYET